MKRKIVWILILALLGSLCGCGTHVVTELSISHKTMTFKAPGETMGLEVEKIPAEVEGIVIFESSNPSVATVNERGLVEAVGEGHTTITVVCGEVSRFCEVVCDFADGEDTTVPTTVPEVTETLPPETTEPVCADCDGKGICRSCGGEPVCDICGGNPICAQCKDAPGKCTLCDGNKGKNCSYCNGDWKCSKCDGNGDCSFCEGSLKCYNCNGSGSVRCDYCKGGGDCRSCKGKGKLITDRDCPGCYAGKCHFCRGDGFADCIKCEEGLCGYCDGDDRCYNCGGDGSVCHVCEKGFDACDRCSGTGLCTACKGEPKCRNCGGSGLTCEECDNGKCRTCGGKNAPESIGQSQNTAQTPPEQNPMNQQSQSPGSNSWIPEGHILCSTCGGDEFCRYCDVGMCTSSYCLFGRVDCSSCDAGQCRRCDGLGYNIISDKDCAYCYEGECNTCKGLGDKDCTYCNDGGYCKKCDGSGWCPTCGGNGYI